MASPLISPFRETSVALQGGRRIKVAYFLFQSMPTLCPFLFGQQEPCRRIVPVSRTPSFFPFTFLPILLRGLHPFFFFLCCAQVVGPHLQIFFLFPPPLVVWLQTPARFVGALGPLCDSHRLPFFFPPRIGHRVLVWVYKGAGYTSCKTPLFLSVRRSLFYRRNAARVPVSRSPTMMGKNPRKQGQKKGKEWGKKGGGGVQRMQGHG